MDRCDVLIVGGGPAGSSCAWRLVRAGCTVAVLDRADFPRSKVCAGWITPAVVQALDLDLAGYARGRTLQPFTGFDTGLMGGQLRRTDFHRTISYGIRRCEFDDYLLRRSGARLLLGMPLRSLRCEGDQWAVNDTVSAPVIVGAGGHFCPVAKRLSRDAPREDVVLAQEAEFRLADHGEACPVEGEWPELIFWPDLCGYGWCVRKGDYLNIGAGRLQEPGFAARVREFVESLRRRRVITGVGEDRWKGHAYLLNRSSSRPVHGAGALLAGDAAGLALAPSGEGILAAVESGLMAAETILDVAPDYSRDRLGSYAERVQARFGRRGGRPSRLRVQVPGWLTAAAACAWLASPRLTRRFLIEDAFLHLRRPAYGDAGLPHRQAS